MQRPGEKFRHAQAAEWMCSWMADASVNAVRDHDRAALLWETSDRLELLPFFFRPRMIECSEATRPRGSVGAH
jgi:hypothetical protein